MTFNMLKQKDRFKSQLHYYKYETIKRILLNSEVQINAHSGHTVNFNIGGSVRKITFLQIILQ